MPIKKQSWQTRVFLTLLLTIILTLGHFKTPEPKTGSYHRDDWPHWVRNEGSCQNTRTKLLIAKSEAPVRYKEKSHCHVVAGKWRDAYTLNFIFNARNIEVDHVVPLHYAHYHGGANWPREKKEAFANDFNNLLLTSHGPNTEKGAKGPTEWLPPNPATWCNYIQHWRQITTTYALTLDWQDARTIERLSKQCE